MLKIPSKLLLSFTLVLACCGEGGKERSIDSSKENINEVDLSISKSNRRLELLKILRRSSTFIIVAKNEQGENVVVEAYGNNEFIERFRSRVVDINFTMFFDSGAEGVVILIREVFNFEHESGSSSISYIPIYDGTIDVEMEGKNWNYKISEIYPESAWKR